MNSCKKNPVDSSNNDESKEKEETQDDDNSNNNNNSNNSNNSKNDKKVEANYNNITIGETTLSKFIEKSKDGTYNKVMSKLIEDLIAEKTKGKIYKLNEPVTVIRTLGYKIGNEYDSDNRKGGFKFQGTLIGGDSPEDTKSNTITLKLKEPIAIANEGYSGLFQSLGDGAVVKDLNIDIKSISLNQVGSVALYVIPKGGSILLEYIHAYTHSSREIPSNYNAGSDAIWQNKGGLIGKVDGNGEVSIKFSSFTGPLYSGNTRREHTVFGGLIGEVYSTTKITISNSFFDGRILNLGGDDHIYNKPHYVGGIIGRMSFTASLEIKNSYARLREAYVLTGIGGVIGFIDGSLTATTCKDISINNFYFYNDDEFTWNTFDDNGENKDLVRIGGLVSGANDRVTCSLNVSNSFYYNVGFRELENGRGGIKIDTISKETEAKKSIHAISTFLKSKNKDISIKVPNEVIELTKDPTDKKTFTDVGWSESTWDFSDLKHIQLKALKSIR